MSDHDIHDQQGAEERAIDQALRQALEAGSEPHQLAGGEVADAAVVREYTELLGLLAYQAGADTPDPRLKAQILASLSAEAAAGMPQRALDELTLFGSGSSTDSADVTLHRHGGGFEPAEDFDPADKTLNQPSTAGDSATDSAIAPFPIPSSMPSRSSWGNYAMAAALALSLVGLGYLGALLGQQRQQIELLQARLIDSAPPEDIVQARREIATLRSRLNMVTTVARKAYPMRRVSTVSAGLEPEGIVYVCGQHQQWYLSLHGLEPATEGHEYHLWFITEQGKIDGGALLVRDDTSSEMEALSMPAGTHGFLVTLEATAPAATTDGKAESLSILLGERPINL